ncbi:MAG: elongation factor P [Candidatus Eisenbacteria bacterium]|nr:elongation factor P [Candidatus Eisenbacteria bacterium]MCC7141070.1 elongation factor P [Candidatus Eisenbacteria bacterium]
MAATQLRVGTVILFEGEPCRVLKAHHHTPGNLRGMMQTKLVSLKSGNSFEHRFRSEDKCELADLEEHTLKFLYRSGDEFHFMSTESYEMMTLDKETLGDTVDYLLEESEVSALYYEGQPVSIDLPNFVYLTVKETEPSMKGATASASPKQAVLETGLVVKVPQFIGVGDKCKIDTRDGHFVERA